jgi:S1-C subfamily serine protease
MSFDEGYYRPEQVPLPPRRYARVQRSSAWWGPVVAALGLCALIVAGFLIVHEYRAYRERQDRSLYGNPREVTPAGTLMELEKTNIAIYKKAKPSVVHITSLAVHRDPFNLNTEEIPEGTGSGFIWDKGGHIVTNYHVIQKAQAAHVTLHDHTTYRAELVGAAPDKDLAVLHIDVDKSKLVPIDIGSSSDLQVGQMTYAIGNPFGLDLTMTRGIVSALGREIQSVTRRSIKNVIQTDAAINPGNSGGPLLDSSARLIGVNTAIYSPSGSSAGIGFAIPVDEVNRVVPQLIKSGKVSGPSLGVRFVDDHLARSFGVEGALIRHVLQGGPAEKASLHPTRVTQNNRVRLGDVITAVDDNPVRKVNDVYDALDAHKAGDTVTLKVQRDNEQLEVQVQLAGEE